jgi:hypothetical protein
VASSAEVFNDCHRLGFGDFMTEISNQETEQLFFFPGAGGGRLAQMLQHLSLSVVQAENGSFGFWCGLWFGGGGRIESQLPGRSR